PRCLFFLSDSYVTPPLTSFPTRRSSDLIQVRYLFGGAELIATATGLTYGEYARRGFFELVTASALVLPLLTGADWLVRNESRERSEEHTSELQSHLNLVCRLLLEKKKEE